jgi:hypothetical protein
MKIHLSMQSQSDDRKLASDDSHWSAPAKNFVPPGQWKTEFPGVLSGRNRLARCSSHFVAG